LKDCNEREDFSRIAVKVLMIEEEGRKNKIK
jgi:hypothetical protein